MTLWTSVAAAAAAFALTACGTQNKEIDPAAVAAMRREMESSRWAYGTIAAQTALISYTAAVSALHGTLAPKLLELEMEHY